MKSTIRKTTYQAIYRLLDRVSPLASDCGRLCGAVCCTCGEKSVADVQEELGIYLLPGEEKLFSRKETWLSWSVETAQDYDFPPSWQGKIYFVRCTCAPSCPRKLRPLQCRFFPLAPHLLPDQTLTLILSPLELPYRCPLIDDAITLTPSFIQATYTVWRRLIQDPLIYDLVAYDSDERDEASLTFVWPKLEKEQETVLL